MHQAKAAAKGAAQLAARGVGDKPSIGSGPSSTAGVVARGEPAPIEQEQEQEGAAGSRFFRKNVR